MFLCNRRKYKVAKNPLHEKKHVSSIFGFLDGMSLSCLPKITSKTGEGIGVYLRGAKSWLILILIPATVMVNS